MLNFKIYFLTQKNCSLFTHQNGHFAPQRSVEQANARAHAFDLFGVRRAHYAARTLHVAEDLRFVKHVKLLSAAELLA